MSHVTVTDESPALLSVYTYFLRSPSTLKMLLLLLLLLIGSRLQFVSAIFDKQQWQQ